MVPSAVASPSPALNRSVSSEPKSSASVLSSAITDVSSESKSSSADVSVLSSTATKSRSSAKTETDAIGVVARKSNIKLFYYNLKNFIFSLIIISYSFKLIANLIANNPIISLSVNLSLFPKDLLSHFSESKLSAA